MSSQLKSKISTLFLKNESFFGLEIRLQCTAGHYGRSVVFLSTLPDLREGKQLSYIFPVETDMKLKGHVFFNGVITSLGTAGPQPVGQTPGMYRNSVALL